MRGPTNVTGSLPIEPLTGIGTAEIRANPAVLESRNRARDPEELWGIGIGRVVAVDKDRMQVTLRIVMGASDDQPRMPVQVPFPAAGRQHFLGVGPEVGDYALVGWMPQESLRPRARTPICLGWIVPGLQLGLIGAQASMLSEQDEDLDDPTVRGVLGPDAPIRYRSIGIAPGEVVASSRDRADLVMNDGVRLEAQGGSQLDLRGDDDSIHLRSVMSQFAASGVRVYQGLVRRDAFLPPVGTLGVEVEERGTHADYDLIPAPNLDEGPGRSDRPVRIVDQSLSPYRLWNQLGWADEQGRVSATTADLLQNPAVQTSERRRYYYVPSGPPTADREQSRYTEWRVEATFESPQVLPLTEMDGADLERLPSPTAQPPQVRCCLGTVVGNDPFGSPSQYGRPLQLLTHPGGIPDPRIDIGSDPARYLAWLVEVEGRAQMGIDRMGRFRIGTGGTPSDPGFDLVSQGAVWLSGWGCRVRSELGVQVWDRSAQGVEVRSDLGPVWIQGGAGVSDTVRVEARQGNLLVRSGDQVTIRSPLKLVQADSIQVEVTQDHTQTVGGRAGLSCQVGSSYFAKRREEHHAGDAGPLHKRTYAPSRPGQVCEQIEYEQGDRKELFKQGSHQTAIRIGNLTYETDQGRVRLRAGPSSLDLDREGIRGETSGAASVKATGSITLEGKTSARLTTSGVATVQGTIVTLRAPVVKGEQGAILSGGTIDPLTGMPFSTWGLGSPTHLLGSS